MDSMELLLPPSQRTQPQHDHPLCEACTSLLAELDDSHKIITAVQEVSAELIAHYEKEFFKPMREEIEQLKRQLAAAADL